MHWFLRGRQATQDGTLPVNHTHTRAHTPARVSPSADWNVSVWLVIPAPHPEVGHMISSSGSGGLVNSVNTCFEVVTVPLHTFSRLLSLFFPPIGPTFFVYLILFSHLTDLLATSFQTWGKRKWLCSRLALNGLSFCWRSFMAQTYLENIKILQNIKHSYGCRTASSQPSVKTASEFNPDLQLTLLAVFLF